jgi:hypothetical protein
MDARTLLASLVGNTFRRYGAAEQADELLGGLGVMRMLTVPLH